jgi:hypothetical protein
MQTIRQRKWLAELSEIVTRPDRGLSESERMLEYERLKRIESSEQVAQLALPGVERK